MQVAFGLYARTSVTSATFDAARIVAGAEVAPEDRAALAEERVRSLLGPFGRTNVRTVELEHDDDVVVLHVVADSPSVLPASLRKPVGLDTIDRTVRVRIEAER